MAVIFLFAITVFAQSPEGLTFASESHNFGEILEANGRVTCTYEFTNTGNSAIEFTFVEPSCSCISLEWTTGTIAAGQTGFIKATFNPRERSGEFTKRVYYSINGQEKQYHLLMNGSIVPIKTEEE